jgi:hypothetical protein
MNTLRDILRHWLPLAAVTTACCALVYLAVQQALRHSGNDPQIQMAEDTARALSAGGLPASVLPSNQIDMAQSLAPVMVVFDARGEPLASSGLLHGRMPHLPPGVFDYVRLNGEDRVTWQPEIGVRMASVVVGYTGTNPGFVMAARSLREVEKREAQLGYQAGVAWVGITTMSLVLIALGEVLLSAERKKSRAV